MLMIPVTPEEAQVLHNLLNVACKAVGLEGAEACVLFSNKIKAAVNAEAERIAAEAKAAASPK